MTGADADFRFNVEPSVGNHFAWVRTQLGLQRTLMAGVRTSVSLIGFGFTVAQFFQRLRSDASITARLGAEAPRDLGLVLIAAGVFSLAVFVWQFNRAVAYLRSGPFKEIAGISRKPMHTVTYVVAGSVMLVGVAAFLSVMARF